MKTPAKAMQLELDWSAPVALKPTYPTAEACQQALKPFEGKPNITYAYCKPKG